MVRPEGRQGHSKRAKGTPRRRTRARPGAAQGHSRVAGHPDRRQARERRDSRVAGHPDRRTGSGAARFPRGGNVCHFIPSADARRCGGDTSRRVGRRVVPPRGNRKSCHPTRPRGTRSRGVPRSSRASPDGCERPAARHRGTRWRRPAPDGSARRHRSTRWRRQRPTTAPDGTAAPGTRRHRGTRWRWPAPWHQPWPRGAARGYSR